MPDPTDRKLGQQEENHLCRSISPHNCTGKWALIQTQDTETVAWGDRFSEVKRMH
jgi:hypothetical protein